MIRATISAAALTLSLAAAAHAQTTTQPAQPTAQPAPAAPAGTTTAPAAPAGTAQPGTTAPAAGAPVMVGGAPMLPTATIVANASKASNLTTLVKAVQAADLAATLSGPGPFTVFAPTNEAFQRLAPGTLDQLMKPEQKASLTKLLTYHVVAGKLDAEALKKQVEAGGGTATLTTVEGQPLKATLENGALVLTDVGGGKSYVTQYDVEQSNGIVHVVNGVLAPKLG
ncbi:fasciclin domain-containing protein [Sphingomonas sp. 2R-10]|uniref:fasciclin domain-containing protein n=1 Tax=Sphingomonas sp. 2R-10 TaxID=3045148 RepID=UPI000F796C74|nr:fasciclin domain-containing protein [Sphingomonas sp. 2R-10]MDJ0276954.1 fasciclin domain-containing protein [Sphingomonas sp. 2R-10]